MLSTLQTIGPGETAPHAVLGHAFHAMRKQAEKRFSTQNKSLLNVACRGLTAELAAQYSELPIEIPDDMLHREKSLITLEMFIQLNELLKFIYEKYQDNSKKLSIRDLVAQFNSH